MHRMVSPILSTLAVVLALGTLPAVVSGPARAADDPSSGTGMGKAAAPENPVAPMVGPTKSPTTWISCPLSGTTTTHSSLVALESPGKGSPTPAPVPDVTVTASPRTDIIAIEKAAKTVSLFDPDKKTLEAYPTILRKPWIFEEDRLEFRGAQRDKDDVRLTTFVVSIDTRTLAAKYQARSERNWLDLDRAGDQEMRSETVTTTLNGTCTKLPKEPDGLLQSQLN